MHGVELLDRQDFSRFNRNLDRKNVLQRTKNTPAVPVCGTLSRKPKLGFPQVQNFKGKGSASFSGARSNTRKHRQKARKNEPKI